MGYNLIENLFWCEVFVGSEWSTGVCIAEDVVILQPDHMDTYIAIDLIVLIFRMNFAIWNCTAEAKR
jgi:hypothetical protein